MNQRKSKSIKEAVIQVAQAQLTVGNVSPKSIGRYIRLMNRRSKKAYLKVPRTERNNFQFDFKTTNTRS